MMTMTREHLQYLCCAMAVAAMVFLFVRRRTRSTEWRILFMELPILLVTLIACILLSYERRSPVDLLTALILVELGVFARVYDACRDYRSESGKLRHIGSIYILAGLVCALSGFAGFPVLLWIIPLALFSFGYFFMRGRRGAANICKGLGVLVSVGFIASIVYDAYEGGPAGRGAGRRAGGALPEVVRPSFVEQLHARNERVETLEAKQKQLVDDLQRAQAMQREAEGRLEKDAALLQGAVEKAAAMEKAAASADEAVSRLKAEHEEMAAAMTKEREARAAAEAKLGELEKTREAARESLAAITEKLTDAAENLKRAVAERDALKAELEALKAAAPVPGAAEGAPDRQAQESLTDAAENLKRAVAERDALKAELEALKAAAPVPGAAEGAPDRQAQESLTDAAEKLERAVAERDALKAELEALKAAAPVPGAAAEELARQLKEQEAARANLAAEAAQLRAALARVREAVAAVPAAPGQEP
jgi:chromosome segregation ATPase